MNLLGLMNGIKCATPEAAYIMCAFDWILPAWRGIRTERYTYAKTSKGALCLYDNNNDPYQMVNLAGIKEKTGLQQELEDITNEMAKKIGDKFEPWSDINKRLIEKQQKWMELHGHEFK